MGNYEIFAQASSLYATIFALGCLLTAGIYALRDKGLKLPISFLLCAFVVDFFALWIEALAVKQQTGTVELWVLAEMLLFLLAMFFMSLSASAFISYNTPKKSWQAYWPAWSLSGLGLVSIVLFTVIIQDGEIINKLRIILPLASFAYLALGLATRIKLPFRSGVIFALVLSAVAAGDIALKFFNIYSPWYFTAALYVLFALSFLMMLNNETRSKLKKALTDITNYNKKIEEIIKLSPFPIIISRLSDDKIVLANDNAIKIFGMNPENYNSYNLRDFFADIHNKQLLLEQLEEQHEVQDFEALIKTPKSDAPFWLLTSANIIDYNNDVVVYAAFQDITSRKAREDVLQNQAERDPLTSLFNRRYFETETTKLIKKATANREPFSMLMLDADFFKKVNDTYGHKIGDKVLIALSDKTVKALRDCDIVARYGGEEFLVFLPNIHVEQAYKVAERLREAIASIVVLTETGKQVRFTVSIGVTSSDISDNVETLIKTADEALYKAKQNGRNRVEIFTAADWDDFANNKDYNESKDNSLKNIHPAFASENNTEVSLLDGAETKNL